MLPAVHSVSLNVSPKKQHTDPVSLHLKREAMRKGRMTTALKIWLNPELVDVKRMAGGRAPGYISFYDRKMAHFKARDKRLALLMKQRQHIPRHPLLRLRRFHAGPTTTRASMEEASAMEGASQAEAEKTAAEMKEARRKGKGKVSLALTRIRRRKRRTQPEVLVKFDPDWTPQGPSPKEIVERSPPKTEPRPLGDEGSAVSWVKFGEALEEAGRAMGDEILGYGVPALLPAVLTMSNERGPESAPSSPPEETDEDRACANMIHLCVAAMHPLERRYWCDHEAREERLEMQRQIWQEEEERAQAMGLDDSKDYSPFLSSSTGIQYIDV
ncbi:hypothetical protein DFH09DRAFT_1311418 [Mycena vulgaris]|nr:hypothetical protein DFH09DRAFT_1311418 [Mycena vulgaris]